MRKAAGAIALKTVVHRLAGELRKEVINHRRYLHMHPELSFEEKGTAEYLASVLRDMGLRFKRLGGTGLSGAISGKKGASSTIALRADMDALPITEANKVSYRSRNDGVMHACGHDVHMSCLLGALQILNEIKSELKINVRFIFQPGEEKLPGGAKLMIEKGALTNPKPKAIIGQHVYPLLPAGHVGFRSGMYMASSDEIYITVIGKGGHAAVPQDTIDPVVIASHLVIALQQIVSRRSDPTIPSVLSFGQISGAGATNVIPDRVSLAGTFRTFDERWRKRAHKEIRQLATQLCNSMGAKCQIEIRVGYPSLKNNENLTEQLRLHAQEYLGGDHVHDLPMRLTSEDFSHYTHVVPGCFYRLGTGNPKKGITPGLHTPTFDVDEDALVTGMGLMAWMALSA